MAKFGIEIELIINKNNFRKLMNWTKIYSGMLERNNENNAFLFEDDSIVYYGSRERGYEVKTKPLDYTIQNLSCFKIMFDELSKIAYSNFSCSVQVHYSRNGYNLAQHYALLYQFLKERHYNKFLLLDGVRMENNSYASLDLCRSYNLYRINKYLKEGRQLSLESHVVERKSDLYELHTDFNTIEFRGLRGHFDRVPNESILSAIEGYLEIMDKIHYDETILNVFDYNEELDI